MANVYVARRRLRVGDRYVMPGDEVPEANSWYHLPTYVHNGSLALVQTDVKYTRGNLQRRPQDPDRADYRVGRERWHGEIQYGSSTPEPPPDPGPQITFSTANDLTLHAGDKNVAQTWTITNKGGASAACWGYVSLNTGMATGFKPGDLTARMVDFPVKGGDTVLSFDISTSFINSGIYPAGAGFAIPSPITWTITVLWSMVAGSVMKKQKYSNCGSYPIGEDQSGAGLAYISPTFALTVA